MYTDLQYINITLLQHNKINKLLVTQIKTTYNSGKIISHLYTYTHNYSEIKITSKC